MVLNAESLLSLLQPLARENIARLNKKLVFDSGEIIGVSIPDLHKLAKQLVKDDTYLSVLEIPHNLYYEMDILQGLIIGYVKKPIKYKIKYLSTFTPSIQNWAVCDTTACNLKPENADLNCLYDYVSKLLFSKFDFSVRFAIVVLMRYYFENYAEVLAMLDKIEYGKNYYIDMAVAWLLAEYTAKSIKIGFDNMQGNPILQYLQSNNSLNEFTIKKAYQKMRESFRIPTSWKAFLK